MLNHLGLLVYLENMYAKSGPKCVNMYNICTYWEIENVQWEGEQGRGGGKEKEKAKKEKESKTLCADTISLG